MKHRSLEYIKYIKEQNCLICFKSYVDPDHLEAIGMGGNRKKPSEKHYSCVPLCRLHHRERHDLGTIRFEEKYKINLWKEAFRFLRKFLLSL